MKKNKIALTLLLFLGSTIFLTGFDQIESYLPERYKKIQSAPQYFQKGELKIGKLLCDIAVEEYGISMRKDLSGKLAKVYWDLITPLKTDLHQELKPKISLLASRNYWAFQAPGGYIFISEGLCDFTNSRDELAFVVAHYLSRAIKKQGFENLKRDGLITTYDRYGENPREAGEGRPQEALNAYLAIRSSDNDIMASDKMATRIMMAGGFDPWASINFLDRLYSLPAPKSLDPAQEQFYSTPKLNTRLANLRGEIGNLKRDNSFATKLIKGGRDSFYWNSVGLGYGRNGEYEKAVDAFEVALTIDPNMGEAHNNMAIALKNMGHMERAIEHYKRSLAIMPGSYKAQYNLALALIKANRFEEAQYHLERAIEFSPSYENARRTLYKLRRFRNQIELYGPDSQMRDPKTGEIIHPDLLTEKESI